MLHRGIKFAYAVLMVVSAALAFIVVRNFDESAVAGPSYVISFRTTENGAPGPRVTEMVEAFVRDRHVNVGRLYQDVRNDARRRIYLAVGDPDAESTRWLAHGYPYFSRAANVELRPYQEIVNIDPDGLYYVYGSRQAAAELLGEFDSLGYHGEIEPVFSLNRDIQYFGHGALLWCFLVVGFVTILATASAVTLNAKSYGIQRLQGQSFARILWRDVRQLAGFCAVAVTGVCALTAAALYLYNRLHQVATFSLVALAFAVAYALAAFVVHVITLALICRDEIVNAVKGEVTAGWAIAGSYLLRFAALLLIFAVGNSVIVSGLVLREDRDKVRTWSAMGDAYYMRISGAVQDEGKGKAIDNSIGEWIRDADTHNEIALAWRQQGDSGISGTSGRDVLIVNNKYLLNQQIYDATGARVRPSDGDTVRILVPQRYAQNPAAISAGITSWVKFEAGRAGRGAQPTVRLEPTRNDQSVLSYERSFSDGDLTVKDPIVVVVTGTSGVIPDDEYTSIASRGELLVDNPDRAMQGLAAAGVDAYVLGMSPFAQEAAEKYRDAERDFDLQVFNLLAVVAVLLITALALSIVYTRRNAQGLFAKYIFGWGFVRTHRWILGVEGALVLVLTAWTWYSMTAVVDSYKVPGAPPPPPGTLPLEGWEPVVVGGTAVLSLALFVLALLRTNATFVRAHSASLS